MVERVAAGDRKGSDVIEISDFHKFLFNQVIQDTNIIRDYGMTYIIIFCSAFLSRVHKFDNIIIFIKVGDRDWGSSRRGQWLGCKRMG